MTYRLKQDLVEKLESGSLSELKPNDSFNFECQDQCMGRCCTNITILLDPWDIEEIARHLGLSGRDFVDQYCYLDFDQQIKWSYACLRQAKDGPCIFMLEGGKCEIYPVRSRNCRTYPVGRAVRFEFNGEQSQMEERLFMVERQPFCFGHNADRTWTVGEWLEDAGANLYYEFSDLYTRLISYATTVLEGRRWMSERTAQMMMTILYSPDALRSKLGISIENVGHGEFYRRRIKALEVILTDLAAGFGFGPQAARFLEGDTPEMSVMDRMKNILITGED